MRLRRGMWAVGLDGGVGIVADLYRSGMLAWVEFHRVDHDGTTIAIEQTVTAAIRQAAYGDIPPCRRPPAAIARQLGYIR